MILWKFTCENPGLQHVWFSSFTCEVSGQECISENLEIVGTSLYRNYYMTLYDYSVLVGYYPAIITGKVWYIGFEGWALLDYSPTPIPRLLLLPSYFVEISMLVRSDLKFDQKMIHFVFIDFSRCYGRILLKLNRTKNLVKKREQLWVIKSWSQSWEFIYLRQTRGWSN